MPKDQIPLYPLSFGAAWKSRVTSPRLMQEQMERAFGWTAGYDAIGDKTTFATEQAMLSINGLSISCVSHTPIRTRVSSNHLSFFLPVNGAPSCSTVNGEKVVFETGKTGLLAPKGERIGSGGQRSMVIATLDEARLVRTAQVLLGQDVRLDLDRPHLLSLVRPSANYAVILRRLLALLDTDVPDGTAASMLAIDDVIYRAVCGLLLEDQWEQTARQTLRAARSFEFHVECACEYIQANLARRITLTDLALIADVPARVLQYGFQKRFGCSPTGWIRNQRLDAARARLCTPDEDTTVTSAAFAVGLFHLGDFSRYYFQKFGELPSQTLAAARTLCL